ncbi:MAG: hypothetical protein H8E44_21875 [Planctomycetes bacterium]|nr:hypothetical protein [Planctomycetota bacterium]
MKCVTLLCASGLLAALLGAEGRADGVFRELPSNASWATYRMSEAWDDGTKREIDVTLKAFGGESVDGVDCTWIEIVFQTPDNKTRRAYQFLTPNDWLKTGTDPLRKALDVWVRKDDSESRRDMSWDAFLPRLFLVCPPKMDSQAILDDTETVMLGDEELKCKVVTGVGTYEFPVERTTTKYRLATTDAVPFGVARATLSLQCLGKCDLDSNAACNLTTGTVTFVVTAMGKNAKPVVEVGRDAIDEQPDARETSAPLTLKSQSTPRSP